MDMGAADFLFTPSVQKVLAATLTHPERSFTLRELMSMAGKGRGGTQQQIERLLAAGVLVEEARRGRQRSIKANTEFFLYPELSSIARKSFGVREPLLHALEPFAKDIREAFVFGSVAKGTDGPRSDVDLAVIGTVSLIDLNRALHETESGLGRSIHLSLYEPEEWREFIQSDPVIAQIAQGPKMELIKHAETA
jgi:predicted nucleotidyltransferase